MLEVVPTVAWPKSNGSAVTTLPAEGMRALGSQVLATWSVEPAHGPYSTISTTPRPTPLICMLLAPWLAVVSVRVPSRSPMAVGVKVRAKVQDRPGTRVGPQLLVAAGTAKSPVTARVMAPVSCGLFGSFLTEQARVEVLPTTWSSKSSDFPVLQLIVPSPHSIETEGRSRAMPTTVPDPAGVEAVPSVTVMTAEALREMVGAKVTDTKQVAAGASAAEQVVV